MSAFIVSGQTMQNAVSALAPHGAACETLGELGRQLYAMNAAAVEVRYGQRVEYPDDWRYRPDGAHVDGFGVPDRLAEACQWLKSVACLRYQCSEGDVPQEPLYERITERLNEMALVIVGRLPEYQEADWD